MNFSTEINFSENIFWFTEVLWYLEKIWRKSAIPDTKKCVGNEFVSACRGPVGQMCRLLAVGPTCCRHVGDFPSQDETDDYCKIRETRACSSSPRASSVKSRNLKRGNKNVEYVWRRDGHEGAKGGGPSGEGWRTENPLTPNPRGAVILRNSHFKEKWYQPPPELPPYPILVCFYVQ